MIFVISSKSV